jgi:hypothetical protein
MASLPVIPAGLTCAQLANTSADGQAISIVQYQTASAAPGSPQYCAVTGHINTDIGFEILLPTSTWRQRYLQVGCGGLCGSINISPNQTTGYKPLADGDFVIAAEDDGHNGNDTSWYSNAQQRVDFAYLSCHDVALVSKGAASGLLTATRQCGSALCVAILSATLVAVHGGTSHRTGVAMFVAAGFALAGLLATRVVPPGPPHPQTPQPQHLLRHHAGGIP